MLERFYRLAFAFAFKIQSEILFFHPISKIPFIQIETLSQKHIRTSPPLYGGQRISGWRVGDEGSGQKRKQGRRRWNSESQILSPQTQHSGPRATVSHMIHLLLELHWYDVLWLGLRLTQPLYFFRMCPGIAADWLWPPLQPGADNCQFHQQVQEAVVGSLKVCSKGQEAECRHPSCGWVTGGQLCR